MIQGALIIAGYVALVAAFGWPGMLAAAAHIGMLAVLANRK